MGAERGKPEEADIYPASRHDTENCDIMLLSFISIIIDCIRPLFLNQNINLDLESIGSSLGID